MMSKVPKEAYSFISVYLKNLFVLFVPHSVLTSLVLGCIPSYNFRKFIKLAIALKTF